MTGFSEDINGLNMNPQASDEYNNPLGDDLDMFTNANFFDVDAADFGMNQPSFNEMPQGAAGGAPHDLTQINFANDFPFADLNALPTVVQDQPFQNQQPFAQFSGSHPNSLPPSTYSSPPNGPTVRALDSSTAPPAKRVRSDSFTQDFNETPLSANSNPNIDEASRAAAEEDKRRRNTAASARFRVKKKQREQAMEKKATDMSTKVSDLETRVRELERDNSLLKNLLTERGDKYDLEVLRQKSKDAKLEAEQ
ncbi:MAG: hypothetical protein M1828_007312 [Chrysothrix sp. TS-e1954]|nr:MAG: hypothetical protein M1828_007312 [Chrysothrix sp. TS-e1954]